MQEQTTDQDKLRAGLESYFTSNVMTTHLNLLDACNLRCSYCINATERKENRVLDIQNLLRFLGVMSGLERDRYVFNLVGGEPFLYPHLDTLCHAFPALFPHEKLRITILTNGTASCKKLRAFLESTTRGNLLISVHDEQIDEVAFIHNLNALPDDLKKRVRCKFLISGKNVLKISDMIASLTDKGFSNIGVAFIFDKAGNVVDDYTEQDRELAFALVRKFPMGGNEGLLYERLVDGKRVKKVFNIQDRLFDAHLVDYHGMWCLAGVNALRVGPDGMARRCFGFPEDLDIATMGKGGEGGAFPESFSRPVPCPAHMCRCQLFLRLPKWREAGDAPEYIKGNVRHHHHIE